MFAKRVFQISGWLGIVELMPLLFLGRGAVPPAQPAIYYGFLGVSLAWQWLFLRIATDPPRYRPMMAPAMVEKASFVVAAGYAELISKPPLSLLLFAAIDFVWLLLFAAAYARTPADKTRNVQ